MPKPSSKTPRKNDRDWQQLASTPAFRPLNQAVAECLEDRLPDGFFNFGLYFNKWFFVVGAYEKDRWKRPAPWTCPISDETKLVSKPFWCNPNFLLDNFSISIALFNGETRYVRQVPRKREQRYKEEPGEIDLRQGWNRQAMAALLQQRHEMLDQALEALQAVGYQPRVYHCPLQTPLVIGLGNEHPTEKGFRFDWTLGIPVIPASSIKGVVRLAYLVNCLNELEDFDEAAALAEFLAQDHLPELGRRFFGFASRTAAQRGRVIFLDAFPRTLPRLKAEIMNSHYSDYYKGDRGPTEDQQPNPQKFWAVDVLDDTDKPLEFVFRFLIHRSLAAEPHYLEVIERAVSKALTEHGLGAKTAIGHGRFQAVRLAGEQPEPIEAATREEKQKEEETKPQEELEVWEKANLTYNKGKQELTARRGNDKAFARGLDLVPADLQDKIEKKGLVTAKVTVKRYGKAWQIIKVEQTG